jgi:hypothetical protein
MSLHKQTQFATERPEGHWRREPQGLPRVEANARNKRNSAWRRDSGRRNVQNEPNSAGANAQNEPNLGQPGWRPRADCAKRTQFPGCRTRATGPVMRNKANLPKGSGFRDHGSAEGHSAPDPWPFAPNKANFGGSESEAKPFAEKELCGMQPPHQVEKTKPILRLRIVQNKANFARAPRNGRGTPTSERCKTNPICGLPHRVDRTGCAKQSQLPEAGHRGGVHLSGGPDGRGIRRRLAVAAGSPVAARAIARGVRRQRGMSASAHAASAGRRCHEQPQRPHVIALPWCSAGLNFLSRGGMIYGTFCGCPLQGGRRVFVSLRGRAKGGFRPSLGR